MERKKLINLIVAIVLALVAVFLVNAFLTQQQEDAAKKAQATANVKYEVVVTATRHISRGQRIVKGMVTLKKLPVNFIQPGATGSLRAVVGKMALVDILPDEQISTTKLTSGEGAGLASVTLSMKTPSGKRAITIPMDKISAVGGMISPGDYVDVIGNFPVPQMVGGKKEVQLVTVTLFQNVLVLAVGTQIHQITDGKGGRASRDAPIITLALSPQEAELISFAQEQGRLKLILRPPLDTAYHPLPVATWDGLLQHILKTQGLEAPPPSPEPTAAPPAPAPMRKKGPQVEIYRGIDRENVEMRR